MKTFDRKMHIFRNGLFVDLLSSMAVRTKAMLQIRLNIFTFFVLSTVCLNLQAEINTHKTNNVRVNVISRRVCPTIVAVAKQ